MKEFFGCCHTHTDRSNFRLRDSTNRLDELCWYAARDLGHNFIAITDHETISTAIDCQKVEKKIRYNAYTYAPNSFDAAMPLIKGAVAGIVAGVVSLLKISNKKKFARCSES